MDPTTQYSEDKECPVCHNTLPEEVNASEAHVATCIENQLSQVGDNRTQSVVASSKGAQLFNVPDHQVNLAMSSLNSTPNAQPEVREEDQCPVCHTSLLSKSIGDSASSREAHIMACVDALESQASSSDLKANNQAPPPGVSQSYYPIIVT